MKFAVRHVNGVVSLLILATTIAVVVFTIMEVVNLFSNIVDFNGKEVLRTVALIVILVKAYRLLVYYMQSHHVSIRYIVEIAIIAPTVELIFTPDDRSLAMNIIYAAFAVANLLVYILYCKKLDAIDKDLVDES